MGNQIDYGMRVYDPRAGRFYSVDPLTRKYPELTPYQYASNRPVDGSDLDGKEWDLRTTDLNRLKLSIRLTEKERTEQQAWEALQRAMAQPSSDHIESTEAALFRANVNNPDNIGGQAAYSIFQNLHDARVSYKDGDYLGGTLHLANAAINTATLTGAGPALGVKPNIEVKTEWGFIYADAANLAPPAATAPATSQTGTGEYGDVGGHHIHAKSAFKGITSYDPNTGFSISQAYMNQKGWNHQAMTNMQRSLFKELAASGRPNTMTEHTNIAVQALQAGGASLQEARSLVAESLNNLRNQGVTTPSNIPWYK